MLTSGIARMLYRLQYMHASAGRYVDLECIKVRSAAAGPHVCWPLKDRARMCVTIGVSLVEIKRGMWQNSKHCYCTIKENSTHGFTDAVIYVF